MTILDNFGPFWRPGKKSVKSDLKKNPGPSPEGQSTVIWCQKNYPKWLKLGQNGPKCVEKGSKLSKMGQRWSKMVGNGFKKVQKGPGPKLSKMGQKGPKR